MKQVNTNLLFHIANVITFVQSATRLVISGFAGYAFNYITPSLIICGFSDIATLQIYG